LKNTHLVTAYCRWSNVHSAVRPYGGGRTRTGRKLRVDRTRKSSNGQGSETVRLGDWEHDRKSRTSLHPAHQELQPRLHVPQEISSRFVPMKVKTQRPVDTLTAREKMIVARVALGLSNAEIAGDLKISIQTVKNHLGSIFEKAGVWSRLELAARLFNHDCRLCPFRASSLPQHQESISSDLVPSIPGDPG